VRSQITGLTVRRCWLNEVIIMENIESIMDAIEKYLDEKEDLRERSIKACRNIIRHSRKAIQKMHKNENIEAANDLEKALAELTEIHSLLKDRHNDLLYTGFMENAYRELSEGFCLLSILQDENLPQPEDLNVTSSSYLLSLGDVVGELRRLTLDCIRNNRYDEAEEFFRKMEKIYISLLRFDYPSGMISIKKTQDNCRVLIEKTRGDLTVALCNRKIEEKLSRLEKPLKEKTEESKKEDVEDLNIDRVW